MTFRLPAVAYVPASHEIRTVFAKSAEDLVHVTEVPSEAGQLICPDCGAPLERAVADIGPAFRHEDGNECLSAGNVAIYQLACALLAAGLWMKIPAVEVDGPDGTEVLWPECQMRYDSVAVEHWPGAIRPVLVVSLRVSEDGCMAVRRMAISLMTTETVCPAIRNGAQARDISLLAISLARLRKCLSQSELAEQILQLAPRTLVRTRIGELRLLEVNYIARSRERLAEFESLKRSPGVIARISRSGSGFMTHTRMHAEWAAMELQRWRLIGCDPLFDLGFDDSAFSVPPDIWRAQCLGVVAPWRDKSKLLAPDASIEETADSVCAEATRRNWINVRREARAKKAVSKLLRAATVLFSETICPENGTGLANLKEQVMVAWSNQRRVLDLLEAIRELAAASGVDLWVGGRLAKSRADVLVGLSGMRGRNSSALNRQVFDLFRRELESGCAVAGMELPLETVAARGIHLSLNGEGAAGDMARAVGAIMQGVRHARQAQLDEFAKCRAVYVASLFRRLKQQKGRVADVLGDVATCHPLDADHLAKSFGSTLDFSRVGSFGAARDTVEDRAQSLACAAYFLEELDVHLGTKERDDIMRVAVFSVVMSIVSRPISCATLARNSAERSAGIIAMIVDQAKEVDLLPSALVAMMSRSLVPGGLSYAEMVYRDQGQAEAIASGVVRIDLI